MENSGSCEPVRVLCVGDTPADIERIRRSIEDSGLVWSLTSIDLEDSPNPESLQTFVLEILENKRLEEDPFRLEDRGRQLERLAALGKTIAMAGHSIKNILTAIRGSMAVLNDILAESEDRHLPAHWGILNRSLNQLNNFVIEMLDYAKSVEVRLETADLNALCRETLKDCAILASENGVLLHDELYPHLPPLRLDPERIKDTLWNLVENGIEACSEIGGGRVTLSTDLSQISEEVTIAVTDNGPGICQSVRDNLFQPFISTKGPRGTGLGLAIVEKNVLAHKGKIGFVSNGEGGSEFKISLPLLPRKAYSSTGRIPKVPPLPSIP